MFSHNSCGLCTYLHVSSQHYAGIIGHSACHLTLKSFRNCSALCLGVSDEFPPQNIFPRQNVPVSHKKQNFSQRRSQFSNIVCFNIRLCFYWAILLFYNCRNHRALL